MGTQTNLIAYFSTLFDERLEEILKQEIPAATLKAIRPHLAVRSKNPRARVVLACGKMLSLPNEAIAAVAVAIELCHSFSLTGETALLPVAIQAYLRCESHVEAPFLLTGLRRLLRAAGPMGIIGLKTAESSLHSESTLDDLRSFQLKETGLLFASSLLIPKDLMGIGDDSSQGLALDIFSKELSAAYRTLEDLEKSVDEDVPPQHILYYLPLKEVKSMTLQRLNAATLSLSSTWNELALPLVQIAQEFSRRIENAGNGEA